MSRTRIGTGPAVMLVNVSVPRCLFLAVSFSAALSACDRRPTAPSPPTLPGAEASASPYDVPPYSATPAPDWDTLFHRSSGWTGADAAYALPLSGDYRPGSGDATD